MYLVRCPNCKQKMKYAPRGKIKGKSKRCVYCGRSFVVHCNLKKSRIVKKL